MLYVFLSRCCSVLGGYLVVNVVRQNEGGGRC